MHDGNDLPGVAIGWALILLQSPGFSALESHVEGLVGQSRALRVTRLNLPDYALRPLLPVVNLRGFPGMLVEHVGEKS